MSTDSEHINAFRARYELFVQEHGDLYENKEVPIDEEDRKKVESFYRMAFWFFSIVLTAFFLLLYFNFPTSTKDSVYATFMGLAGVGGFVWCYQARKKALTNGVKTVVKGVITGKKTKSEKSDKHIIKLSNREEVNITPADFEKYTYGDIVQVELLGSSFLRIAAAKVISLGKLPD